MARSKARDIADAILREIADGTVTSAKIADNNVGATQLNVSGDGTAGQVLKSDGDGSFTWADTAEPFTATTVSGTTPSLDLGTYNYFSSGSLTGDTTLSFTNVPTAKRWFYDQTSDGGGEGLAQYTSSSDTLTLTSQFNFTGCCEVGDSGNKLFVGGQSTGNTSIIYVYNLTTANDITTAVASTSFSLSSQIANNNDSVTDLKFKPDGTVLLVNGQESGGSGSWYLYQYNLSTPWDISTATYSGNRIQTYDVRYSFHIKDDGTVAYFTDRSLNGVTPFTFSTGWDVSTGSQGSTIVVGGLTGTNPHGIIMNSTGTLAIIHVRSGGGAGYLYTLSTPYDWSTATYTASVGNIASASTYTNLRFFDNGKKISNVETSTSEIISYGFSVLPYTLSFPASVQNSDYAATQSFADRYLHEFITTDGGTNVWLVGSKKYDDN